LSRRGRSTLGFHSRDLRFETLEDRRVLAVLTVNTLADTVANDNLLSLREAISAVNAQSSAGLDAGAVGQISGSFGDNDTIQFDASLSGQTITLGGTELEITEALTIDARPLTANVTIDANEASRIFNITATTGDFTFGGLTLTGGRTTANSSAGSGGAIRSLATGELKLDQSTISGNSTAGSNAHGGGIFANDAVTLTQSTVSGNSSAGVNAKGGGIWAFGSLTISQSTVSGNSTTGYLGSGGGIWGRDMTLTQSTVSGNSTEGDSAYGGGIRAGSLTLTQSTVSGNSATENGGGIRASSVTLTQSTVSGNSTTGDSTFGGGISAGSVTLTQSTVSGNSTTGDFASGGGISAGIVTLTQSTVSGNSATGNGGGIRAGATVTVTQSTITDNHTLDASAQGGGVFQSDTSFFHTFSISGSIVAGNTAGGGGDDLVPYPDSTLTVNYSLIGTGVTPTAGGNNVVTNDPELEPLADFGGPTQTHALLPGSPAIDAGDPDFDPDDFDPPLLYDQRGAPFDRVAGGRIDIGAFEGIRPVLVVDSTSDVVDGDYSPGNLSLREAVLLANANSGTNTITFDAALSGQTITLGGTELVLTDAVTIDATALDENVTIDADQLSRIFNITASTGDFTLAGLTLTGGRTTGDDVSFPHFTNTFSGGAVRSHTTGNLTLDQSIVSGNSTTGSYARGGGVFAMGSVTLTQSTLSGNSTAGSSAHGGGIFTLPGPVTLTQSTVSGNSTAGNLAHGGGIRTIGAVTLTQSTVSGNSVGSSAGGGMSVNSNVTLTQSTVSGNSAGSSGGGIYTLTNVTLNQSTVSGNSAGSSGGGIYARGFGNVTLTQSTVSGNSAGLRGGGIWASYGVTLTQSTVTENRALQATSQGGGVFQYNSPYNRPFSVSGSIVAGNTAGGGDDLVPDPDSTLTVNYSLIGVADGLTFAGDVGNLTGTAASPLDPQLDSLADNDGPTQTHALLPGSPAIDAGDPAIAFDPDEFDQRGAPFVRVFDGRIDIGAFEVQEAVADNADFNSDGYVDGFDFLAWQRGFGLTSATKSDGDANGDGNVDSDDLAIWEQQFSTVPAPLVALSTSEVVESATNYQAALDAALTVSLLGASANDSEALADEDSQANEQQHFDSAFASDTFLAPAEEEGDFDFTSDEGDATTHEWLAEELLEAVFG